MSRLLLNHRRLPERMQQSLSFERLSSYAGRVRTATTHPSLRFVRATGAVVPSAAIRSSRR
eukprot:486406-Pleurochrysis_carterae.AAC.2